MFSTQAICSITKIHLGQPYYSPVALGWHCMWFAPSKKRNKPCVWTTTCWIREAYVIVMNKKKLCCGNTAWRPSFPPGIFLHTMHLHNFLSQNIVCVIPKAPEALRQTWACKWWFHKHHAKLAGLYFLDTKLDETNWVYLVSDTGRITTFYSKLWCLCGELIFCV